MSMMNPDLELYTESASKAMNVQPFANVIRANQPISFDFFSTLPLGLLFLICCLQISTATMEHSG